MRLSSVRPPILQYGCRETGEISYRCVFLINAPADIQSFQESFQSSGRGRFGDQARTFCDHVFIFIRVTIQCLHAFISTPSLVRKHYATNSCTLLVVINAPYHQWICNDIAHVVIKNEPKCQQQQNICDIVRIFIVESTLLGNMNLWISKRNNKLDILLPNCCLPCFFSYDA